MIPTPIAELQVYEVPPLTEEGEAIVVGGSQFEWGS